MPDIQLLEAANNKTLKRDLRQHLSLMIQDPRSFNMSKNFTSEWLDIERLERVIVDKKHSGGYTLDVKTSFKNETYNFFHHVLTNNRSIMEFIDSDYAMLDWRLANFYGLPPVRSLDFKATPVRKDQNRGGILTNGGILTALSTGKHSSPIKRGVWIAKRSSTHLHLSHHQMYLSLMKKIRLWRSLPEKPSSKNTATTLLAVTVI